MRGVIATVAETVRKTGKDTGLAEQGLPLCYYLCGVFILAGSNAGVQCGFPQVL